MAGTVWSARLERGSRRGSARGHRVVVDPVPDGVRDNRIRACDGGGWIREGCRALTFSDDGAAARSPRAAARYVGRLNAWHFLVAIRSVTMVTENYAPTFCG